MTCTCMVVLLDGKARLLGLAVKRTDCLAIKIRYGRSYSGAD